MSFAPVLPVRYANLRSAFSNERAFARPPYFEEIGQNQGMALYRATLPAGDAAELTFDRIADSAQVWLDGQRIATVDRRLVKSPIMIPARKKPSELEILVEAMGRINSSSGMEDRKGLDGRVFVGKTEIKVSKDTTLVPIKTVFDLLPLLRKNDKPKGFYWIYNLNSESGTYFFVHKDRWQKKLKKIVENT